MQACQTPVDPWICTFLKNVLGHSCNSTRSKENIYFYTGKGSQGFCTKIWKIIEFGRIQSSALGKETHNYTLFVMKFGIRHIHHIWLYLWKSFPVTVMSMYKGQSCHVAMLSYRDIEWHIPHVKVDMLRIWKGGVAVDLAPILVSKPDYCAWTLLYRFPTRWHHKPDAGQTPFYLTREVRLQLIKFNVRSAIF